VAGRRGPRTRHVARRRDPRVPRGIAHVSLTTLDRPPSAGR
jgi:hypothetical protein